MINQTEQTLFRLSNLNAEQTRISYQMATGKKIDNGSEDASTYSREIFVDDRIRTYEGLKTQIERTTAQNNVSDSTVGEMKKLFELAKTELIKASTDTTSDEGRKSIALNIAGIKENLLDLANTQVEGEYLFSGSDSSIKPFTEDSSGKISYQGDNISRKIAVDDGSYRERGINGYDVMTYPSSTAYVGETFNFKESDTIIDEDGSIWEFVPGSEAIPEIPASGGNPAVPAVPEVLDSIQKFDESGNTIDTKFISSNDELTPPTYQIDDIGTDDGTKFEARSSIFDLLDTLTNTLNKVDSTGNSLTDEEASALLAENQGNFSEAYDALNVSHSELGAKNKMFELSLERVSAKLTQYNILSQEIGAVDLAEVAIESKNLELTYTALYSTIQKTNELSLVNFLK
ncbi:flagellar hook-associated protein FlgL [Poseidonibacter ostreae]|jgi:flagellar hook-associated protein 3 FlgL|uniref:Flagellar hook-associated protein 3 n=1 Tax=Poseidonibacter ostreae TaxID=2654171 RepID=A0A6L4WV84_9BACT|nr:flagellar hook-associated protein FlgL [Poseidonibacter ostreae]KAB7885375.1 flagellar hook-associated protein 3 [Poseidonibacter ostreae]KAB7890363.1 flagellar hook-associated protein 3 [Poseidonibacter ostreae]KAB7890593.1 flagellar hook-associated protein 3 [Poseidonibacter ostreae]